MSARGKCFACGHARQYAAIEEISLHQGPQFQHWRRRMAASVGAVFPEDDRLTA
jgi:hypothetical protein